VSKGLVQNLLLEHSDETSLQFSESASTSNGIYLCSQQRKGRVFLTKKKKKKINKKGKKKRKRKRDKVREKRKYFISESCVRTSIGDVTENHAT
jgi:hypothetical protein